MDNSSRAIVMSIFSSARVQQWTNVKERAQHKTQFEKSKAQKYNDEGGKNKSWKSQCGSEKGKKKRSKNNPRWKNQSSNQGNRIPDSSKERSKTIARYPQDLGMQGIGGGKQGGKGKNKKYKMLGNKRSRGT